MKKTIVEGFARMIFCSQTRQQCAEKRSLHVVCHFVPPHLSTFLTPYGDKRSFVKSSLVIFIACLLLITQPAYAVDLQTAKSQGLVGETPAGYLSAVTSPSAETKALIESVNLKRKQKYQEIAASNKTSLQTVEQLAGKKAIEKSRPGSYIKQGGSWQKK